MLRYNGQTGAFMGVFVPTGTGQAFTDIAFGSNGNLFVSDYSGQDVKEYNGHTGAFVGSFASTNLVAPQNLVFGPDGNLYVADERSIVEFNGATGAYIRSITAGGLGFDLEPVGLTFGPDGNLYAGVYILGTGESEILEYNGTTGALIGTLVSPDSGGLLSAHALEFRPDGDLYVANSCNDNGDCPNDILRYNGTTGAFIDAFVPAGSGGLFNAVGFTFGPPTSSTPEPGTLGTCGMVLLGVALFLRQRVAPRRRRRKG